MASLRPAEPDLLLCHLYNDDPAVRLERELREMTGEGFDGDAPLNALELTAIDCMHYRGNDGTDEMLARFPHPKSDTDGDGSASTSLLQVLDLGSGFGGCARYVASKLPGAAVTALEIQGNISRCGARLTARCSDTSLAPRVFHVVGDILDLDGSAGKGSVDAECGAALPAAWGTYDVAFAKLVVLHIPFVERPGLWRNLAAASKAGGLLYVEDYFEAAPLTPDEVKALVDVVGCPPLPTRAQYVGQLEAAGYADVEFTDVSSLWATFVGGRAQGYVASEERHLRVQGAPTFESMGKFYKTTAALFAGGRLGGAIITARFPAKEAPR